MEYDTKPQRDGSAAAGIAKKVGLPMYKGKVWLWVALAAVFVCAVTVTAAAALGFIGVSGGSEKRSGISGNAGVAAAYAFFSGEQEQRVKLTSGIAKEMGGRLLNEPFEMQTELKIGSDGLSITNIPFNNIIVGIDAKYDMKDLGVKVSALGMEVFGGYLIDNNVVADVMGKAGSKAIERSDAEALKGSMGLKARLYALLPFLPKDDGMFMGLLEALAASVPDKYTKTELQDVYSPKDKKSISMDAVTTTLDEAAIKEVASSLKELIKGDVILSRDIQQLFDGLAAFSGMDAVTLDDMFKQIDEAVGPDKLADANISWSVYSRNGKYVGVHLVCSLDNTDVDYTYISEYNGSENLTYTKQDINGTTSEGNMRYTWQGDKFDMEADITGDDGSDGNMTEHMSGSCEFAKTGGDYTVTGDMTMDADVPGISDVGSTSFDIGIEATVKIGGGLGTLKETRGWNDIYDKEWGRLEDVFSMFMPGQGLSGFGDMANNL